MDGWRLRWVVVEWSLGEVEATKMCAAELRRVPVNS